MECAVSLCKYDEDIFDSCYDPALNWAMAETGLSVDIFPVQCSFTAEEVLNIKFLPE
ncbi:DUF29 family protein [Anabaena sp. FACHB-1237]|uniref:DUF29 family protein n=1 Tax=Anabaena sp. FACHB-1237 TaxID=2692769 RepID=UPI002410DD72|nr:DUF29 family protein [Anabaena sp. FACHB-1237]